MHTANAVMKDRPVIRASYFFVSVFPLVQPLVHLNQLIAPIALARRRSGATCICSARAFANVVWIR